METLEKLKELQRGGIIRTVKWSHDGHKLAVGGDDHHCGI